MNTDHVLLASGCFLLGSENENVVDYLIADVHSWLLVVGSEIFEPVIEVCVSFLQVGQFLEIAIST